jgi:hypothetical protein
MRKSKRIYCVDSSKLYQQLLKEKFNGTILPNGDLRVGNDMAVNSNNSLYKIQWFILHKDLETH